MSAIDALFRELRAAGRKALMPFVTAGDPDLAFTAEVICHLAARGCSLFELGIPYSDPIADGPVIQASYARALERRIHLDDVLSMVGRMNGGPEALPPIVTMLSYAIVFRHGPDRYAAEARQAGIAGLIVPDLPVEESDTLAEACRREDLSLIPLIAPTTPRDRALRIAERASGFIYYVSVMGTTGERTALGPEVAENVGWLREHTPLPVCIGFGISRPEHVRALAPVADGLIVGSAIVRRMAEAGVRPREEVIKDVGDYVAELLAAM